MANIAVSIGGMSRRDMRFYRLQFFSIGLSINKYSISYTNWFFHFNRKGFYIYFVQGLIIRFLPPVSTILVNLNMLQKNSRAINKIHKMYFLKSFAYLIRMDTVARTSSLNLIENALWASIINQTRRFGYCLDFYQRLAHLEYLESL